MSTFIIPCKYNREKSLLYRCLKSIRSYHPDDEIVIVDSDSEDKTYFQWAEDKFKVIIEEASNKNYTTGAIWHAYNKYERGFYYFLHDSVELIGSLKDAENNVLSVVMHSKRWEWPRADTSILEQNGKGSRSSQWARGVVDKFTSLPFKETGFNTLLGPMFCCSRDVLDKVVETGFNKILPTNKSQSENMERLWGLVFTEIGLEKELEEKSILGTMRQGNGSADGDAAVGHTIKLMVDGLRVKKNSYKNGDRLIKYWMRRQ